MNRLMKMVSVAGCSLMIVSGAMAQTNTDKAKDAANNAMKNAQQAAQDAMNKMDPKMAAEMQAWAEMGKPGEMHQRLAKGVGEWACVIKQFGPDGTATESKGNCSTKAIFEGRYFVSNFEGEMPAMGDMPAGKFNGVATLAYNNASEQIESTWIDSMNTGIMYMTGSFETATKTMTLKGECICPMTRKPKWMKEVTTWTDDNHFVSKFYGPDDNGKEMLQMEISYTRTSDKPAAAKPQDGAKKTMTDAEKKAKEAAEAAKNAVPGKK